MEKIKLVNGIILTLSPMGIKESAVRRSFTFTTDLTHDEILTALSDSNIATVQYLSDADEILTTYVDCVTLKVLSKNIETSEYTAEISVDAVERQIKAMQAQINALTAK